MSTKFYGYTIPKDNLWALVDACRAYFLEKSVEVGIIREVLDGVEGVARYDESMKALEAIKKMEGVEQQPIALQLFDRGSEYIVRPIAWGYQFQNAAGEHPEWGLTELFVDTRTDPLPDTKANLERIKDVDREIDNYHYFLATILSWHDLGWMWLPNQSASVL